MRVITGQFGSKEQAEDAVKALTDVGVAEAEIDVAEAEGGEAGSFLVTAQVEEIVADAAQAILGSAGVVESARATDSEQAFEADAIDGYEERKVGDPIVTPFPR